ncbi:MAG: photosynthetic reaction center cytochrome c subunit family protein [Bryobacteraceae bacterium]
MKPFLYTILMCAAGASFLVAQAPAVREPLPNMQAIAESLGVTCEYCHARGPGAADAPAGPSKISVAKQMIAMTRELNKTIETASAKATGLATKVDCVTCHRGVPIPKPLGDVLWETATKQGTAAALTQYRDLRTRFFGKATYDFSEQTLLTLSQRVANVRPDDALAFARLNTEFYPNSSASYQAIAFAYTRKVDDANAIVALEKALELDPGNNVARGQLEQLKSYQRRR